MSPTFGCAPSRSSRCARKLRADLGAALDQLLALQDVEHRERRGAGGGVRRVRVEHEVVAALRNGGDHRVGRRDRTMGA